MLFTCQHSQSRKNYNYWLISSALNHAIVPIIAYVACSGSRNEPTHCDQEDCPGTHEQQSGIEVVCVKLMFYFCVLKIVKQLVMGISQETASDKNGL